MTACRRPGSQAKSIILQGGVKWSGTKENEMKKMGRPRKNGMVGPAHLARALMIVNAYSKARGEGLKHSAAVRETVDALRRLAPEMHISETEVKRVVAKLSPRGSQTELRVKFLVVEGEEAAIRRYRAHMPEAVGIKEFPKITDPDLQKPLKTFPFGFGRKTHYPRHNAKKPKS